MTSPFAVAAYAWLAHAKRLVWKRSMVLFKPVDLKRTLRGLCLSLTYSPAETKRNKQIAASSQERLSYICERFPPRLMTGPGHRWHISLLCTLIQSTLRSGLSSLSAPAGSLPVHNFNTCSDSRNVFTKSTELNTFAK